jgi:peptide/nickel transport system permease protein
MQEIDMARHGKVLVVDDEKGIREGCRRILQSEGYEVESVESGEAAVERLKADRIDLALIDLKMPGMSGMELLDRIREIDPEIVSVMMTGYARVMCGQAITIKENDYVTAARSLGGSSSRVMFRHILPNAFPPIIVMMTIMIGSTILAEAGLSYLGVGIGPPLPSWCNMMQGLLGNFSDAPWLVIAPGIFIFLTTLAIYLIGDGLRDALDPWVTNSPAR